jgi:hypothetical protein
LNPLGIEVQDGYQYRKTLKYFPDFIIQLQNDEVWAIDYLTGVKKDERYGKHISNRFAHYKANNLKPYFFIDLIG